MPTLSNISSHSQDFLRFKALPWFPEAANQKGLAKGGIYLLSGPPGSGKSTLALQMGIDLARQGYKVLYLTLEMTPENLKEWIQGRIFPHRHENAYKAEKQPLEWKEGLRKSKDALDVKEEEKRIGENFWIDSTVNGLESLPDFFVRQVQRYGAPYYGTHVIIVDSLQGLGPSPTSTRHYQRLFEFNRYAKDNGVTALLVGHITKGGAIAGPRSLEHNVDCVLYLRKAMRLRPLFIPKNRFGPERHEPMTLVLDKWGCLTKSKHSKVKASRAFGYLPGMSDLIEVQALVKLPKYGEKPGMKAPYLPKAKLSQLVGIASSLEEIDLSDLTFEINCAIPGGRPYFHTLDLPLVVSMLSSYFQRLIPPGSIFVGEVDLASEIRPVLDTSLRGMAEILAPDNPSTYAPHVERIFVSERNEKELRVLLDDKKSKVEVRAVASLESLIKELWPDASD